MKQNAQWLSQVRMRSKTAEDTSTPNGSPAALSTRTRRGSGRTGASDHDAQVGGVGQALEIDDVARLVPVELRSSSPTARPARAAGDAAVTEVTVGADIAQVTADNLGFVPGVDRVMLAEPRGFCAGVEKAIKALAWMVRVFEPPVYCYHEIVHNRHVVDRFRAQGVIFVDDVAEVPPGAP